MNCESFRNTLRDLEESGENLNRLGVLHEHLQQCEACQKELPLAADTLDLFLQMKALHVPDPGGKFWDNLPGQIRSRLIQKHQRQRLRIFGWSTATVVGAALLLFFLVPFWDHIPDIFQSEETLTLASEVHQDPWASSPWQNMQTDELSVLYIQLLTTHAHAEALHDDEDIDHTDLDTPASIQVYEISEQLPDEELNSVLNNLETIEI